MKQVQIFRLALAFALAVGMLVGLQIIDSRGPGLINPVVVRASGNSDVITPNVEIIAPDYGDLLTQTQVISMMTYHYLGTNRYGTMFVGSTVSVTMNRAGDVTSDYREASYITDTFYVYTWTLPLEDHIPYTITARIYDPESQQTGISDPLRVYVDTQPPTVSLTLPPYTEEDTFTVFWRVKDRSGEVSYTLKYRRDDQMEWTDWLSGTSYLTQTDEMSATVTQEMVDEGYTYYFRLRAYDEGNNMSEVTESIRVGKWNLYLPLILRDHPPIWRQGKGSKAVEFRTPVGCGDVWYAGTGGANGVWRSMDNARNWSKIADSQSLARPVVANPDDCAEAFVAVWGEGVYRLNGTTSFTPITENLGEPYIYGLTLKENYLYAGTNSYGIYRTDVETVDWQPVNTGIDVDDQRIRSLFNLDGTLYAGSRKCSFYVLHSNDEGWNKQIVLGEEACDDEQVWSVASVQSTLYAGLGGDKGLYYLQGGAWKKAPDMILEDKTILGLAYDESNDDLYVSAYDAGIFRCELDNGQILASGCEEAASGLTTRAVRELHIHNNLLVAGSDDGVWYLPLSP